MLPHLSQPTRIFPPGFEIGCSQEYVFLDFLPELHATIELDGGLSLLRKINEGAASPHSVVPRSDVVPFRHQHYPPETLAMMYRVLDECVAIAFEGQPTPDPDTLQAIRNRFALLILGAVARGELDPEALKQIVLNDFRGVS